MAGTADYPETKLDVAQTNPNRSHFFYQKHVPVAVRTHVMSFLDARTLCFVSESSVMLDKLSKGRNLWVSLLKQDFKDKAPDAPRLGVKGTYLGQRIRCLEQKKAVQMSQDRAVRYRRRQEQYRAMANCMHFCQEACVPLSFAALVVTFVIMTVVRLDDGHTTLQWGTVAPLLAALGLLFITASCMCYLKYARHPFPFEDNTYNDSNGIVAVCMKEAMANNLRAHKVSCGHLSLVLVWLVFVCAKVTDAVSWHWAVVFSPWFLALALMFFSPKLYRWINGGRNRIPTCIMGWVLLWGPVSAFSIMLVLRLEGHDINMGIVLIPAWLYALASMGLCCVVMKDEEEVWPAFIWCSVVAPILTFEIMVTIYSEEDTDWSFAELFSPFFVWCFVFVILAIWVSYAAYDDGNSRRRRERADRDRRIQDEQVQEDQRRADEIKQLDEILNMA